MKHRSGEGNIMKFNPCTENYVKLRNAQSRRISLLQGGAYQQAFRYEMPSPERIHMSKIMQTETVAFRNMRAYVHTYVHVQQLVKKENRKWRGNRREKWQNYNLKKNS